MPVNHCPSTTITCDVSRHSLSLVHNNYAFRKKKKSANTCHTHIYEYHRTTRDNKKYAALIVCKQHTHTHTHPKPAFYIVVSNNDQKFVGCVHVHKICSKWFTCVKKVANETKKLI